MLKFRSLLTASLLAAAVSAEAQTPRAPVTQPPVTRAPATQAPPKPQPTQGTLPLCGGMYQIGPPAKLPPANAGTIVYQVAACFEKQGGYSVVDPQTYLYYMQVAPMVSDPAADKWVKYDDKT